VDHCIAAISGVTASLHHCNTQNALDHCNSATRSTRNTALQCPDTRRMTAWQGRRDAGAIPSHIIRAVDHCITASLQHAVSAIRHCNARIRATVLGRVHSTGTIGTMGPGTIGFRVQDVGLSLSSTLPLPPSISLSSTLSLSLHRCLRVPNNPLWTIRDVWSLITPYGLFLWSMIPNNSLWSIPMVYGP
jgi:hypothetical protein